MQFANTQLCEESSSIGISARNLSDTAYADLNALDFQVFANKGDACPVLIRILSEMLSSFFPSSYVGIDLRVSPLRPEASFIRADVRFLPFVRSVELGFAFSLLDHVRLTELPRVLQELR